ncbi:sensor histidine kinase [Ammoniphilus resinae]|uniref:sensor histidine kinase n=1 Tax=Ammoniphilus resinae TaxID=861532 RepID=UPI00315930C8
MENWSDLWEKNLFDFPYIALTLLSVAGVGMFFGIFYGLFWSGKIRMINHQLDSLLKGQRLDPEQTEPITELKSIHNLIHQIDEKQMKQAELSQQLATKRAEEREKSLQEVVVQERNRLARELHDSVSQQLFAASMMISAMNETTQLGEPRINKQLVMIEKMIHQSQLEMRALLLHLRPAALKGRTLQEGIQELLKELVQKVSMEVEWKMEPIHLEKGIEDHLFRILQEAVSNTLRHAKANALHLLLIERDGYIIMRLIDDGIGFDVNKANKPSSYGLQNMQERALEIGGQFKIVSLENQGTRIEVKVPVMKTKTEIKGG